MNIELTVKEENGIVKIKIMSPDKPVAIETATNKKTAGAAVPTTSVQEETTTSVTESDTTEAESTTVSALSEKITSLNREYERLRKAVYRAKKKLAELVVPQVPGACPQTVPNSVPGDKMGQGTEGIAYNTTCNTNTKSKTVSTMSDHIMSHTTPATTNTLSPEPMGNCLPFVPEENPHRFIPLANLPEVYQNLLQAWNNLPLRSKLKGLYPDVAQKLHHLLQEFGEATLHKAIRMVADSPFLLGKSSNSSGWIIYFGWLLNPANLKKILENKYRARSRDWSQGYDYDVSYPEYIPWSTVQDTVNHATVTANAYAENPDATADYGNPVPNECSTDNAAQGYFLDPEYMLQGLDPLTEEARSNLAWAAARLGLTKTPAA